ncbi:MAG: oligoendopeptidase F [Oscillospiraceae bacterium]|nr:oligoendopeptidase F [Oscillospiraceae bacterium]
MATKIPERSEIRECDKWAITDIYPTDEAWLKDYETAEKLVAEAASFQGRLGENADDLLNYLRLYDRVGEILENLANYAQRKSDEDTRVAAYQALTAKFMSLYVAAQTATAFETPEILAIPEEKLEQFYLDQPELELYRRRLFNILRSREHVLSDAEERLLAAAGEMASAPDTIYSMFADADITFPDAIDSNGEAHALSQGTFVPLQDSSDRVLRRSAYENLYHTFGAYKNTAAAVLNAQVKSLEFFSKARKYESSLHASLDHTHVPVEVYYNLIESVHKNMDKMHRYVSLRKKLLGVDELHFYDVYTPLVKDVDRKIPYEDARNTVYESLAPLGEGYRGILKEGFENRWIDVYQNVGKRSGAYSAGAMVHPYVLLNYSGSLDSQFTLAHEMGHALHSYLSNHHQPAVYRDYVIFVAEVASTCNEALLMEHLLQKTTDKKERAYLINHFLEQFKGTLYRQTMFAEFELKMGQLSAQGVALTAEKLCEVYRDLNAQYFGPDMVVDDEIAMEWARIPHFYYNYYVFQYATGYAAAIALSRAILKEGQPAVDRYLNFLCGGCSKDPIDLLKDAGVDMTTTEPVDQALELFGELLDEMEALMKD